MQQVLLRSAGLLRRPFVLLAGVLWIGTGMVLLRLPLFNLPGYELSSALAVLSGLLGGVVGAASAFQEQRLIQGRDPRPQNALRTDDPLRATLFAAWAAFAVCLCFSLLPLAASVALTSLRSSCSPFAAISFFPILVLPSALLASSAGACAGFMGRTGAKAGLLYILWVIASLALSLWPIYFGPQVRAFNHFLGYFPGPLYDEVLSVGPALLYFRLQTFFLCALFWFVTVLWLDMRRGHLTRPHARPVSAVLLASMVLCVLALERRGPSLGFRMTDGALRERLAGSLATPHFELIYPQGKPRAEAERLSRDLEFRFAQISAFLGEAPAGKIRVWLYRTADQKSEWVGAAHTQFAKPWRQEIHLNDQPFPHSSLKHELAHAMSAPWGTGPFGVTSRFGVLLNMGVIEGLAEAADNPNGDLTLHQWAGAMRRQKLAPPLSDLVGSWAFYAAPPARAYVLSGSFFRFLHETHGPAKLRELYGHGDFGKAYGQPLSALIAQWESYVDGIPLDEAALTAASARFQRGSLFARRCAREVAALSQRADERFSADPQQALELYGRCAKLSPDDPGFVIAQGRALLSLGYLKESQEQLSRLVPKLQKHSAPLSEAEMLLSDLAYRQGDKELAGRHLDAVLAQKPPPAMDRTARIKQAALSSPAGQALWGYFEPGHEDLKLLLLQRALGRQPKDPFVNYLLGRRLTLGGAPALAVSHLQTALEAPLPDSLKKETYRLLFQASFLAADCQGVTDALGQLPDLGPSLKEAAQEWKERCAFEQSQFQGMLPPPGAFL